MQKKNAKCRNGVCMKKNHLLPSSVSTLGREIRHAEKCPDSEKQ